MCTKRGHSKRKERVRGVGALGGGCSKEGRKKNVRMTKSEGLRKDGREDPGRETEEGEGGAGSEFSRSLENC